MPATTPQDRKRPKAEAAAEPVTFDHDGKTYTLPVRTDIKAGMLRRHRNKEEIDYMFSLIEDIADAETIAALDDLDMDTFNDLIGEWGDHVFGGDAGKS